MATERNAPPPQAAPVPLPRLAGYEPLLRDFAVILPRLRGWGTTRRVVEGSPDRSGAGGTQ